MNEQLMNILSFNAFYGFNIRYLMPEPCGSTTLYTVSITRIKLCKSSKEEPEMTEQRFTYYNSLLFI